MFRPMQILLLLRHLSHLTDMAMEMPMPMPMPMLMTMPPNCLLLVAVFCLLCQYR
jgi:hypothetical protein